MLEVMANLRPDSVQLATAAIEPDFVGRRFLHDLGFRASGDATPLRDEPRALTVAVPILTPVDVGRQERWRTKRAAWTQRLAEAGVTVVGTAAPSAPRSGRSTGPEPPAGSRSLDAERQ